MGSVVDISTYAILGQGELSLVLLIIRNLILRPPTLLIGNEPLGILSLRCRAGFVFLVCEPLPEASRRSHGNERDHDGPQDPPCNMKCL